MSAEARYLEPELPDELAGDYRRTFERLRGHFRVRGILPEEAADMAQEAAMRAYVHVRRRGMTGDTLFPLMNQIARNMLIDRHRRSAPQMVSLDDAEPIGDVSQDPTQRVVTLEAHRAVREAVAALPERHRDVILMALQGLTPAQVAERMGIERNAADALLHRARRSLKDRLRVVGESAMGLATWAYLKLHGRRAAAGGPQVAVAGFQGSVAAAAAALVVVLNVGGPVAQAVASGPASSGSRAGVPSLALGGAGARPELASGDAVGGSGSGLVSYGRDGSGGIGSPGKTAMSVNDVSGGHETLVGVEYERSDHPSDPSTVEDYQRRSERIACSAAPVVCRGLR